MTTQFNEATWDDRYRASAHVWSGNPNPQLVSETSELAPGHALDVGCGEGADALWLARRGWRVTAVDFSAVALERAAAHAASEAESAVRIHWAHHNILEWTPPAGSFDLVSSQFMHLPSRERRALFHRLAAAVLPGGTLLIVAHHPSDLVSGMKRPQLPDLFFTAEEAAEGLDPAEWEILVSEARTRDITGPDGDQITIADTVLRARRHVDADG
ncbi:MAG: class I SAM-dependent methyltransferase [Cryobacterium sp.]|uniref:class I SAM-dependent methyltransferase n=1 Tax=unclassified Cryobacterium TaxID=2649013 RepID=UPI0018CA91E1|nr:MULTISPECIES: class I SAM-dependent methyltransferase [unclassified Cryobacterium]MCY7404182.1 class I SAM-dependent methyltransferase [Cryobacterium sp.]MEC5153185.1 SAM-dependent methyltransferase [Cryobacterium sp. CAN_C3]